MRLETRRCRAAFGLLGLAAAAAGLGALPLSIPRLQAHRAWVKALRAEMRGASYLGEAGTVLQAGGNDCGAACLKMILAAHRIEHSLADLTLELNTTPSGTSLLNIRLAAARLGLPARSWTIQESDLSRVPMPAIALIHGGHFVVIRRLVEPEVLEVDDPALGRLRWPVRSFRKAWRGVALVFDPSWVPS